MTFQVQGKTNLQVVNSPDFQVVFGHCVESIVNVGVMLVSCISLGVELAIDLRFVLELDVYQDESQSELYKHASGK